MIATQGYCGFSIGVPGYYSTSPMELNQPGKARVSQGNRWISLCFEFRDVRGYPKIIQNLLLKLVVWDTHILGNLHVYTTIRSIRQSCASWDRQQVWEDSQDLADLQMRKKQTWPWRIRLSSMILPQHVLGVLVGALEQDSYFSISWEFHHELHHFSEVWRKTTNQCLIYEYSEFANLPSSYSGSWICSVFLQSPWFVVAGFLKPAN
jgi:hypothetical protein